MVWSGCTCSSHVLSGVGMLIPSAATHFLAHSWGNNWAFVVFPIFGRNSPELRDWGDVASQCAREETPVWETWAASESCVIPVCDTQPACPGALCSLDIIKTILAFCPVTALDAALWDRSRCLFMQGSYLSLPASVSCSWFLTSPPAFCFPPNVSSTLSFLSSPFYTCWASSSSCSSYL